MAKRFNIEIETTSPGLTFDMFETKELTANESRVTLADGSTALYAGSYMRKSVNLPEIVSVVLTLAGGVGTSVAGSWLYDKLKGKPVKLRINRQEVEITAERIRIVIEEIERDGP